MNIELYNKIYDKVMPMKKREEEKYHFFGRFVARPISIWVTMLFLDTKWTPLQVTKLSIFCIFVGSGLFIFGDNLYLKILGWVFFFLWSVFDGVDGNLARYRNQCSQMGDLWDTTGGYLALVLTFFSVGIMSFFDTELYNIYPAYMSLILGGATSVIAIFPRLIMHKKKSYNTESQAVKSLSNKSNFGLLQGIALNFVSPSAMMQPLLLLAIIFHCTNIFILCYFFINTGVMIISLRKLLGE